MARRPFLTRAVRNASAMMRASEWGSSAPPPPSSGSAIADAIAKGDGSGALGISTVMACVKVLYEDFEALPFRAYTGDPLGSRGVAPIQPQIVSEPFGPDVDVGTGMGQVCLSRVMRGNAFLWVVDRDSFGYPTQLRVLHPDKVRPFWNDAGRKRFKLGYSEEYGTDKIVQIQGLTMPGDAGGMDILTAQRLTWMLAMHVTEYADSYFEAGGDPAGVISTPGNVNREKARLIRDLWTIGRQTGSKLPAVLSGGATWQAVTVTPENAQFLETRRFLREEICGIYGVPMQRIQAIVENASQGGGKGLDAIDHGYVTHTLGPIASSIENVWNRMIPGDARTWTGFDWDSLLRAAALERATIAHLHRVSSVRNGNEIRAGEGWAKSDDPRMDDYFQPLNSNTSSTGGAQNAPAPGTIPAAPGTGGD